MKVGFCGTDLMGTAMVERLLAAGHDVTVWNRTAAELEALVKAGARVAATPAALAVDHEVVILCLPDASAVLEVVFGPNSILSSDSAGIVVDHSGIPPDVTRNFASVLSLEVDRAWVDAPICGGVSEARAGQLTVMAGGRDLAIRIASPFMTAYASRITHIGDVGSGQTARLCNTEWRSPR
jgi:2-hydroxy-3-oxopropionate reductase